MTEEQEINSEEAVGRSGYLVTELKTKRRQLHDILFCPFVVITADAAIRCFGSLAQLDKTREECNELAVALKDFEKHHDNDPNDVYRQAAIDETADVLLTALQAARILGSEDVADRILFKAQRLLALIEGK